MDGNILLVTDVKGLGPEDLVTRYESIADIESGFRVLNSEIEIELVYHRRHNRIRVHAIFCIIAFMFQRVIRSPLKA